MEWKEVHESTKDIRTLCKTIRELIDVKDYEKCESMICSAMERYPHAPEPHNLIGILLEKRGDHLTAMKHFRAAWALDPTYVPARQNLDCYGTFFSSGNCAYDESDCKAEEKSEDRINYKIKYDEHGIGRIIGRG